MPESEQDRMFEVPQVELPKRPDQLLFDVFDARMGRVRTKQERDRRNGAIKELLASGVTPEELDIAIDFCEKNFTTFTEMAICGWLSRALHDNEKAGSSRDTFLKLIGGGDR